jgi:CubicO group peptidase (beta-lactamase class C family)
MNNRASNKVRILILNHDVESKDIQARLKEIQGQLPAGIEVEIERKSESNDPAVTAETIKEGNYDIALINENINVSIWKLIQESPEFPEKPIFYLAGKIESVLDREIKQSDFSGALAITKDGKPLLRAGYGKSNQAVDDKNSPESQFNIASIMKTITALGVVRLVEDKLREKYKDKDIYKIPISELLPKDFSKSKLFKDFTLHELLTHTSGLSDEMVFNSHYSFEPYYGGKELSFSKVEDFVDNVSSLYQEQKLEHRGKMQYCNYGFFLLGLAIQAISGQDYYSFIQVNVLNPAKMAHTHPRKLPLEKTALPYIAKLSFSVKTVPDWLIHMTEDESNRELNQIAVNAFKIYKQIQKESKGYDLVQTIFSEYEKKSHHIDEKKYSVLCRELAPKLDEAYALFCHPDASDQFQFKLKSLRMELIDNYKQLEEWIKQHPDKIQQAENLKELLGPNGLAATLCWPLQVLGGIQINMSIGHPAGCWFSTVDDLLKLHQALWKKKGALHQYAVKLLEPKEAKEYGYGYGLIVSNRPGAELGHVGSAPGVKTSCFTYPKKGFALVLLANDDSQKNANLQFDIECFLMDEKVKYFDARITPDLNKSLLDNIMVIHKTKASSPAPGR